MKHPGVDGGLVLCFLMNLVFNAAWALPAVVLAILHFAIGIPLWPAGVALLLWVVGTFAVTFFMSWAVSTTDSNGAGTGARGKSTVRYSSEGRYDPRDQQAGDAGHASGDERRGA